MILDSSAIVAIFFKEPGYQRLVDAMVRADKLGVGAPTLAETAIVLEARLGWEKSGLLPAFLSRFVVTTVPFEDAHWRVALDAYRRFGRRNHPARLNFGDCMSYATARLADQRLLCVGDDFPQTDLPLV